MPAEDISPVKGVQQEIIASRDAYSAAGNQTIYNFAAEPQELAPPGLLPRDVPGFTGRRVELARLMELADGASVVVSAIDGVAGAGKTALAVHAAHRLLPQFPDGQLYADFQGYAEGQEPAEPGAVLEQFLRRLGLPSEQVPVDLEERSGLFRHMLSRRRVLVLLDNVVKESQARPLLPGAGSSLVLITSRSMLPGLELDYRINLDVLPDNEAIELLTRLIGEARSEAEAEAVRQIVTACGALPLALHIAGQLLSVHPRWPVSRLAEMLADEQKRLDRLAIGDRQVRAAFLVSYQQLTEAEARLFRLLGLHPGPQFSVAAAARLAGIEQSAAAEILERLVLVHLVIEDDSDRFRMHDLLRLFARETCHATDGDASCHEALRQIMDYYLGMANYLACCLDPRCRLKLTEMDSGAATSIPSPPQAVAWFEVERPNLLATLGLAVGQEWHEKVWELGERLGGPLELLRHLDDLLVVCRAALDATQAAGARPAEARALGYLGIAYLKMRRFDEASSRLQAALVIFRELGDRQGEAVTLGHLGTINAELRNFDQAARRYNEAMAIDRERGDRHGQGVAATNLGNVHLGQRKFDDAIECYSQGLEAFRENGDRQAEAGTANNLGDVYGESGQFEKAVLWFNEALTIYREVGDVHGSGGTLANLGNAHLCLAQPEKAVEYYTLALEVFQQAGDRFREAETLNNLGNAKTQLRQFDQAILCHQDALAIYRDSGDRHPQALALNNLGRTHFKSGHSAEAIRCLKEALEIYRETGDQYRWEETIQNLRLANQAMRNEGGEASRSLIDETQAALAADLVASRITRATHDNFLAIAEFCWRQDATQIITLIESPAPQITPASTVRLGCLGLLPIGFSSTETGWWTRLQDLAHVTGIPENALAEEWQRQESNPDISVDSIEWLTEDGGRIVYRMFSSIAALAAVLALSPRRDEFLASLSPEMRRALDAVGWS